MRAIRKFKSLLAPKGVVAQPREPIPHADVDSTSTLTPSVEAEGEKKQDLDDAPESTEDQLVAQIIRERQEFLKSKAGGVGVKPAKPSKGQVHDVTDLEPLHLGIGTGDVDDFAGEQVPTGVVSDSPTAAEFNIYDRAFDAEIERIKRSSSRRGSRKGTGGTTASTTLYHTKLSHYKADGDENVKWAGEGQTPRSEQKPQGLADLVGKVLKDSRNASQERGTERGDVAPGAAASASTGGGVGQEGQ